ncbi:MAG: hypothetical protein OEW78_03110 [Nitrosopumilus sp.]|uniref:hypothetical protein n=1 Tax=Nitrosopumilus sp. TaxID=2024843 RepID=UPI00246ECA90|nr:hypothetical protein [Nitrosopumilus sp.]MDH5430853.1 hypothetical protein [Nitrosopumilus sp.]MDH5664804.1 hypothetical protein [Nitrosopumilus sp.]MDH5697206.1 hypothetical protein [Nitrosopumilus sp.]
MKTSLFETFKLTNQLTGKAKRQRKIIKIIGTTNNSNQRTKVEISRKISVENKQSWKNSYSGVYNDIEKILLPQKIIEEGGRIPLKKGPRLLQKEGTGYYKLTKIGSLLLFCIEDNKMKIDFTEFTDQQDLGEKLNLLYAISPTLCFLLLEKYISTMCISEKNIIPITLESISKVEEFSLKCNLKFIKSILSYSRDNQRKILQILSYISSKH